MNRIILLICLLGFGLLSQNAAAQVEHKVAFANVELIMVNMEEMKSINSQLAAYEKSLTEQLQAKQNYYQVKFNEYMTNEQNRSWLSEAQKANATREIQNLETEIQKSTQDAEYKLLKKQNDLMIPLSEKIQAAIDAIASEKGFDYVINESAGGPFVLYGVKSVSITEAIATKLGVSLE